MATATADSGADMRKQAAVISGKIRGNFLVAAKVLAIKALNNLQRLVIKA